MRVLLDTHVFLWVIGDHSSLDASARRLIEAADEAYVSAASIWEIAIKSRLGKLLFVGDDFVQAIGASGLRELPVRAHHAAAVPHLPLHHTDPFDRLLIAQALSEPLHLLTVDPLLAAYGDLVKLL